MGIAKGQALQTEETASAKALTPEYLECSGHGEESTKTGAEKLEREEEENHNDGGTMERPLVVYH